MELTDDEVKILREFLWKFRYALSAFLRECPRPSSDQEYKRRMEHDEVVLMYSKFELGEAP